MSSQPGEAPRNTGSPERICAVSRVRPLVRTSLLGVAGTLLVLPALLVLPNLHFVPTPTSNRLTDYSLAVTVAVPLLAGLYCYISTARWFLLVLWPAPVYVRANGHALIFQLGPFGRVELDWEHMEISYYFERDLEPDEEPDPDLLGMDEDEEARTRLPLMRHPNVQGDVNDLFRQFAAQDESELAAALRLHIKRARTERGVHDPTAG